MQLWPHQQFGISETLRLFDSGVPSLCLSSPTGGGKTEMMIEVIKQYVANEKRVNVYSARRLWTAQLAKRLSKAGISVGLRAADWESWEDADAPVQICSTQTEVARVIKRDNGAQFPPADLLIIDEVHLNKADSMTKIVRHYEDTFGSKVLGVSATPLGVCHLCSQLLVAGNNTQLRECGALVRAKTYEPFTFDLPKVRRSKQVIFSQRELDQAVKEIWSQHIVGNLFDHWKRLNPNAKPSLCMAPGVKEAISVAQEFEQHGVCAAAITGEGVYVDGNYRSGNDQEVRDEIFLRFLAGDVKMLANRFVLREAIDLPAAEFLQLATRVASLTSFVQVVGRVLRASPTTGKTEAILCDHAGSVRLHGSPNMDRDDQWRNYFRHQDENAITKDRVARMVDPNNNKEREPITCGQCGLDRTTGRKCPQCGYEADVSVRKVIQEDGKLKLLKGEDYRKRHTQIFPGTVPDWISIYHRMRNAKKPKSFKQARAFFKYEFGYWPPSDLPLMPLKDADWSRKIRDVPYQDLIPDPQQQQKAASLPKLGGKQRSALRG